MGYPAGTQEIIITPVFQECINGSWNMVIFLYVEIYGKHPESTQEYAKLVAQIKDKSWW